MLPRSLAKATASFSELPPFTPFTKLGSKQGTFQHRKSWEQNLRRSFPTQDSKQSKGNDFKIAIEEEEDIACLLRSPFFFPVKLDDVNTYIRTPHATGSQPVVPSVIKKKSDPPLASRKSLVRP